MKKMFFVVAALLGFTVSLQAQTDIPSAQAGVQYGQAITPAQAITVAELDQKLGTDSMYNGQITGEVIQVCQSKGCFIHLKRDGDQEPIMVKFKDYGFFMPQDIVGKTIVLQGQAKLEETSVDRLRHYAEDEGKSAEEIAKITEPKVDINIVAEGVIVIH